MGLTEDLQELECHQLGNFPLHSAQMEGNLFNGFTSRGSQHGKYSSKPTQGYRF